MDKSHPLSSPMVVRSLEVTKDLFRPKEENEELLSPEAPYLNAIGALMYLANYTRLDIASQLIYQQDTVQLYLKGTGMELNMN